MKKYPSLSNLIVKLIIPVGLQNGFVMNTLRPRVRQVSAEENTTNVDWMMMDVSVNNGDTDWHPSNPIFLSETCVKNVFLNQFSQRKKYCTLEKEHIHAWVYLVWCV